jgi:hypothetical protein
MAALDVLDGTKPSLAPAEQSTASPLAGEIPKGTVLLVRAIGLEKAKLPKPHPMFELVESLDAAVGGCGTRRPMRCPKSK